VSLVIDSSITLSCCFEDERTDVTATLLYRVAETGALVPTLWRLEVANGVQVALRRGRIDVAYRDATIANLRDLAIDVDPETDRKARSEIQQLAALKWGEEPRIDTFAAAALLGSVFGGTRGRRCAASFI
jgi:predicted nucleic acid-binding protein